MFLDDTIAAISTSLSPAGIGIIRVSGKESVSIVDGLYKGSKLLNEVDTHTINYGHIMSGQHIVDEVLVSVMRGPNSFTKEDVVEVNCHGGVIVLEKVLSLILQNGARLAEPGEFTKRAFLNGRIDLSQAESIMDIINAKSDMALEAAQSHLKGILKDKVEEIKQFVIEIIAHVEASIDYPEYDIEALEDTQLLRTLGLIKTNIKDLIDSYDNGKLMREGIKTAIIGKPNVGKSSLMNALLKEQRAIVTDIPGTTRDVIEEYMNIHGVPLKMVDTAGIRDTEDTVEKIGVEKAKTLINEAELIIFMADASSNLEEDDYEILKMIKDKKLIVLLNKIDLEQQTTVSHLSNLLSDQQIIPLSLINNDGVDLLEKRIKEMFSIGSINFNDQAYVTNIRHKKALDDAIISLDEVVGAVEIGMPPDCYAIDLKDIYGHLGELTGDNVSEDLIKTLFSQFCLGK